MGNLSRCNMKKIRDHVNVRNLLLNLLLKNISFVDLNQNPLLCFKKKKIQKSKGDPHLHYQ